MAKRAMATTKIDRAAAEQFGREAFVAGLGRAPCLSVEYDAWRAEKYADSARAVVELGTEFLRGWDAASLAA